MTLHTLDRNVPAGTGVRLLLQGLTYNAAPVVAFGGGNYRIEGEVVVELKTEGQYVVRGELSEDYQAVWLEQEDGTIVSEKIVVDTE